MLEDRWCLWQPPSYPKGGSCSSLVVLTSSLRWEDEDDYEYEFSAMSMRIRFRGQHFSKCACSEKKTPFSSPEAALLLVSTKNRDLWRSPTPEVRDSRTSRHSAHVQSQVWQIWLVLISIYCVYRAIQKRNVVGLGQRSRFLVLTKRSAASGDENEKTRTRSRPRPPI